MATIKKCFVCGDEISQGYQQFGILGQEVCIICYLKLGDDLDAPEFWYGLGPHDHKYDEQGNVIIGSTTFKPLDQYQQQDGSYLIDGYLFSPDPDASGLGVWSRR